MKAGFWICVTALCGCRPDAPAPSQRFDLECSGDLVTQRRPGLIPTKETLIIFYKVDEAARRITIREGNRAWRNACEGKCEINFTDRGIKLNEEQQRDNYVATTNMTWDRSAGTLLTETALKDGQDVFQRASFKGACKQSR